MYWCADVCLYRQCVLLCCPIRSRPSRGWALVKTAMICPRSGRRTKASTSMFSLTLLWSRGQRKCLEGFWLMIWGWWDDHRLIVVLLVLGKLCLCCHKCCAAFQGKTLTTIALIVSNFRNGKPLPLENCVRCRSTYSSCFVEIMNSSNYCEIGQNLMMHIKTPLFRKDHPCLLLRERKQPLKVRM